MRLSSNFDEKRRVWRAASKHHRFVASTSHHEKKNPRNTGNESQRSTMIGASGAKFKFAWHLLRWYVEVPPFEAKNTCVSVSIRVSHVADFEAKAPAGVLRRRRNGLKTTSRRCFSPAPHFGVGGLKTDRVTRTVKISIRLRPPPPKGHC